MKQSLKGSRIAALAADGFENVELTVDWRRLVRAAGNEETAPAAWNPPARSVAA